MIAIKITFPAGRWHATAWGTHVNEGVPEWPPCPWRILRALLAAWFWKDRRDEAVLRSLLDKLAAVAPDYLLPEAAAAHTRHYMPDSKGVKTKIFDTFVHVSKGQALWIRWNVELTDAEQTLLARLLVSFSYLGRAESLVEATLADRNAELTGHDSAHWTCPAATSTLRDGEPIRLLAPQEPAAYAAWAASQIEPVAKGQKPKGKKKSFSLPTTLHDALQLDTAEWKKDGWNLPPGSRWLDYIRPSDAFKLAPTSRPHVCHSAKMITVARFAITAKVPPGITQSLSLAERFHKSLCKILDGTKSPALTGVDDNGKALTGNAHAYYLPECDHHGYITHVNVHAPCGFSENDLRALSRLRKVWSIEGKGNEIEVILLATGQTDNFNPASPYFRPAKIWRSLTPFVAVRHAKATRTGVAKIDPTNGLQIGSPEHDCLRLLTIVAHEAKPIRIVKLGTQLTVGMRGISALDFQRQRRNGVGMRGDHRGFALEIEFAQPTAIPFGLGYCAHFGLGLFAPVLP